MLLCFVLGNTYFYVNFWSFKVPSTFSTVLFRKTSLDIFLPFGGPVTDKNL